MAPTSEPSYTKWVPRRARGLWGVSAFLLVSLAISAETQAQRGRRVPPTGTLLIEGDQPGAELFIDGEPMGILPVVEPLTLSAGEHTVRAVRPGFTEFSDIVQITRGRENASAGRPAPDLDGALGHD